MSAVRLPYYPQLASEAKETRFGVLEITTPTVYETPLAGKVLVRVDTLECLRSLLGDEFMSSRNSIYCMVSGRSSDEQLRAQLAEYYKSIPQVTQFVNNVYDYGCGDIPLDRQVLKRLLEVVNDYSVDTMNRLSEAGGKHLITTHLYSYYKFSPNANIPDIKGVRVIC